MTLICLIVHVSGYFPGQQSQPPRGHFPGYQQQPYYGQGQMYQGQGQTARGVNTNRQTGNQQSIYSQQMNLPYYQNQSLPSKVQGQSQIQGQSQGQMQGENVASQVAENKTEEKTVTNLPSSQISTKEGKTKPTSVVTPFVPLQVLTYLLLEKKTFRPQ